MSKCMPMYCSASMTYDTADYVDTVPSRLTAHLRQAPSPWAPSPSGPSLRCPGQATHEVAGLGGRDEAHRSIDEV